MQIFTPFFLPCLHLLAANFSGRYMLYGDILNVLILVSSQKYNCICWYIIRPHTPHTFVPTSDEGLNKMNVNVEPNNG